MTQRERVLTMLKQAGREGVTNGQFVDAQILRYSARIMELRNAGHVIEKHRITDGTFRYELQPANKACLAGGTRGVSGGLGGSETAPRGGSSAGEGTQPFAGTSIPAAAISGKGCGVPGGDGSRAVTTTPTLFELPRSGSAGHYEDAA